MIFHRGWRGSRNRSHSAEFRRRRLDFDRRGGLIFHVLIITRNDWRDVADCLALRGASG